jgi:hypothetical protein
MNGDLVCRCHAPWKHRPATPYGEPRVDHLVRFRGELLVVDPAAQRHADTAVHCYATGQKAAMIAALRELSLACGGLGNRAAAWELARLVAEWRTDGRHKTSPNIRAVRSVVDIPMDIPPCRGCGLLTRHDLTRCSGAAIYRAFRDVFPTPFTLTEE